MGFDRNTVTGFVLLAALFMGYFWYISSNQQAAMALKKRQEDSIAALKPKITPDTAAMRKDSAQQAQQLVIQAAGSFAAAASGTDSMVVAENDLIKASFSKKGGWLKQVELKKFKGPEGKPVVMGGGPNEYFGYSVMTGAGQAIETGQLFFSGPSIVRNADSSQTLTYTLNGDNGNRLEHVFTVKPGDYRIQAQIRLNGATRMISGNKLNLNWRTLAHRQQQDVAYEKTQTRLVYQINGDFDYTTAMEGARQSFETPVEWLGLKQQFFNATLLAPGKFQAANAEVTVPADSVTATVAAIQTSAQLPVPAGDQVTVPLSVYYGPNDYHTLKAYNEGMHGIVDLGSGIFAFVKWINRWMILPVFEFLSNLMSGAGGWTILLLTIFIRLLIAPLTYSSYLSGAKMKALRPEIDAMKERLGNDQQAVSMEQMKLFREAGVNPLGGCIPALFQIPIFFALYSFFNSNLDLRGVPFLWAKDLSSYDSILNMGFEIPFYGAHISLFTITACLTSMLISIYSMASTPDTGNPMMKYMPYIFPVMMLFFFNKLPSALTWYYTVSNVITLVLQFVIQNYIIDQTKILAQIKANRAKPKKTSKWQERLAAMQEAQKKVDDLKKKNRK